MEGVTTKRNYYAFVWHAILLAFTTTFTEINTVLPGMIVRSGGGHIHVGVLTAIMVGAPMLSQLLFAGLLTPKPRKKPFLLLGIYLRVGALLGVAWTLGRLSETDPAVTIALVYGWMLLFATSGAFAGVSYTDILGKSIAGEERKRFFVIRQTLSGFGVLVSALITREILKRLDYPQNYEWLFTVAAIALFVAAFGFLAIREQSVRSRFEGSSILTTLKFIPSYLREDGNLRNFIIMNNLTGFATTLVPFYVILARDAYSLDVGDIGNFLLVQIAGMILSNIVWSRIVKQHAFKGVLFAWIAIGTFLPLLALITSSWLGENMFLAVFFFSGSAMSARKIALDGVLLEISENDTRALYSGINGAFNLTTALFPLMSGIIISLTGYTPVFILASVSMLASVYFIRQLDCGWERHAQ
ncbi:MAG: MFS transporter [Candidatus Marinimicrobia bacterium]|nr:MFS transporter [Candidatus Neomarinimicrobiota bacterium]MCF7903885.1 MFS transporter [Candidatus Neomarinimicrobiota bacterium]